MKRRAQERNKRPSRPRAAEGTEGCVARGMVSIWQNLKLDRAGNELEWDVGHWLVQSRMDGSRGMGQLKIPNAAPQWVVLVTLWDVMTDDARYIAGDDGRGENGRRSCEGRQGASGGGGEGGREEERKRRREHGREIQGAGRGASEIGGGTSRVDAGSNPARLSGGKQNKKSEKRSTQLLALCLAAARNGPPIFGLRIFLFSYFGLLASRRVGSAASGLAFLSARPWVVALGTSTFDGAESGLD